MVSPSILNALSGGLYFFETLFQERSYYKRKKQVLIYC